MRVARYQQQHAVSRPHVLLPPVDGPSDPFGEAWPRDRVISLVVDKATEWGLVPWEFLGLILAEGLDVYASRPTSPDQWREYWEPPYPTFDVSFGLGQKNVRYSDEYAVWCVSQGFSADSIRADEYPGADVIAEIRDAYFNPYHALDVAAKGYKYWRYNPSVSYGQAASAYNGPSYYHNPEANRNYGHYMQSGEEAKEILGLGQQSADRMFYEDVPDIIIRQGNNWTCAVRSTYAGLWQLAEMGKIEAVTYGDGGPRDVYDWLVPRYDNSEWGLLDHTGAGIVEALGNHGISAHNLYPAFLPDVQLRAGSCPVMLGGINWNHWTYVRGLRSDGMLVLENPSPGWGGIGNELRDSFGRLGDRNGAMSLVWIDT